MINQELIDNPINMEIDIDQTQINLIIEKFSNIILEAANKTIGKTNTIKKNKTVPWWNNECDKAIKNYKKSLNKFKKTKSLDDHINLKKARAQARFITKRSKTESWHKYTNSINTIISSTEMWKKIKAIKGINHQTLPSILHKNDTILSSPTNIAETFAQFFEKNSCDSNYDPDFIHFKNTEDKNITNKLNFNYQQQDNHINLPFSITELSNALSNCKSKSPGPDGIPYSFIKNLPKLGYEKLLQIYNIIWEKGIYPKQ